jgi:AraC-like DNA-binding protein
MSFAMGNIVYKKIAKGRDVAKPRGQNKTFVTRQESLYHKRVLERSQRTLQRVVKELISKQHVLADRKEYASVLQTPLRDNLHQLRSLASELSGAQYSNNPFHSGESEVTYASIKATSHYVVNDILPALKNAALQRDMDLTAGTLDNAQLNIPSGMADKMLRELLINAIMHNPATTQISINCYVQTNQAIFEVCDNGMGISADVTQQAIAAEEAQRVHRQRRLSDAETHLSLASVNMLARLHGGDLEIKTAIGWGTHIRLTLPCSKIQPHFSIRARPRHSVVDMRDKTRRQKVMIIADQPHIIAQLSQHFAHQYVLDVHSSLDSALLAISSYRPDVIIADFSWQVALTIQLCKFLRVTKAFQSIPVLMLATAADTRTRIKAYASGVSAIIDKPLDVHEVKVVIENVLSLRQADACEHLHTGSTSLVGESHKSYWLNALQTDGAGTGAFKDKFESVITQHYQDESFNRTKAASLLNMSEKTLQRRLRDIYDSGFREYLRRFRLDKAKTALLNGQTITHVCFDVGFGSTSYFGQCFKHEFGYSPSMLTKASA